MENLNFEFGKDGTIRIAGKRGGAKIGQIFEKDRYTYLTLICQLPTEELHDGGWETSHEWDFYVIIRRFKTLADAKSAFRAFTDEFASTLFTYEVGGMKPFSAFRPADIHELGDQSYKVKIDGYCDGSIDFDIEGPNSGDWGCQHHSILNRGGLSKHIREIYKNRCEIEDEKAAEKAKAADPANTIVPTEDTLTIKCIHHSGENFDQYTSDVWYEIRDSNPKLHGDTYVHWPNPLRYPNFKDNCGRDVPKEWTINGLWFDDLETMKAYILEHMKWKYQVPANSQSAHFSPVWGGPDFEFRPDPAKTQFIYDDYWTRHYVRTEVAPGITALWGYVRADLKETWDEGKSRFIPDLIDGKEQDPEGVECTLGKDFALVTEDEHVLRKFANLAEFKTWFFGTDFVGRNTLKFKVKA